MGGVETVEQGLQHGQHRRIVTEGDLQEPQRGGGLLDQLIRADPPGGVDRGLSGGAGFGLAAEVGGRGGLRRPGGDRRQPPTQLLGLLDHLPRRGRGLLVAARPDLDPGDANGRSDGVDFGAAVGHLPLHRTHLGVRRLKVAGEGGHHRRHGAGP